MNVYNIISHLYFLRFGGDKQSFIGQISDINAWNISFRQTNIDNFHNGLYKGLLYELYNTHLEFFITMEATAFFNKTKAV